MRRTARLVTLLGLLMVIWLWGGFLLQTPVLAEESQHHHEAHEEEHDFQKEHSGHEGNHLELAEAGGLSDHEEEHSGHGEEGHHDGHEPGVVELSPEALVSAGIQLGFVERRVFHPTFRATGELKLDPDRVARVGPRISGRVEELLVQEGEQVRKGQVLARLVSVELGEAKADFLARKAKLDLAQSNAEREKGLRSKGISSEKELLEAQAAYTEARVELDAAENRLHILGLNEDEIQRLRSQEHQLASFVVRAPLAGVILERPVALGQMAEATMTLFVIADPAVLWAQLNIFERDLRSVQVGASVTLSLDAFPDQPVVGVIENLSAVLDERTRSARARVVVDNPEGQLRPGMFLTAQVQGSSLAGRQVLTISESALQREGHQHMVFVPEGESGRFRRHLVEVGERGDGFAEIRAGLTEGMQVAITGSFLLKSELAKESMGGGHSH